MTAALRRWALGEGAPTRLPVRIAEAVRAHQSGSERIVTAVQALTVTAFGLAYLLAPKTAPVNVFQPVPWALGAYLLFTVGRGLLARREALSPALIALSVIVDMALLLGLVWSFHVQYMQPPGLYLKAPTLLYVFVFISLRALRLEARYVLLAGITAAVGWVLLAFLAARDPGVRITRDFVEYMTSHHLLVGAEVEKVAIILTVTGIQALAIVRGRRLLVRATREEAVRRDLSRYFDPTILPRLTEADDVPPRAAREVRRAAVLVLDLRGFTRLSRSLPPERAVEILTRYQSLAVPIIRAHGGAIDKFMGDGILATFGAAGPSERFAADALGATMELLAALDAWNRDDGGSVGDPCPEPLRVGAAVTTGPVLVGAIGVDSRLEYTVIGDAVNLAAKLEKQTKREGVQALATGEAYELAVAQGYRHPTQPERRAQRRVGGVELPLDLVVLSAGA